jgi:glyoxylase-like metal-dependent hydrolase (beta-lactamase superfamily II)
MSADIYPLDPAIDGVHDITLREIPAGRRYRAYVYEADVPTLFDAGFEDTTDILFDAIAEIGIEPERLIVTHEDPDHTGGFRAVVDQYDLETWVPRDDADAVEDDAGIKVDHRYEDGDTIGPFEAVHVAGHTPGSSVLIDQDASIAFTGDVVFGADVRGLPKGYLIPPPEIYTDDLVAAEQNLENLLPYEFDMALVSHGSAVTERASEKLERFVEFPAKPDRT